MTDGELRAIEDIEAAASLGPWSIRPWQGMCECGQNHESQEQCEDWYWSQVGEMQGPKFIDLGDYDAICQSDLEFIACARDAVPALLAEVERLRCKLAEVQELIGADTLDYIEQLENQVSSYYHEFGR